MALKALKHFLKLESSSAIFLFLMAILAFILSNSSFSSYYYQILDTHFEIGIPQWHIEGSVLFWINEGLMSVFFLLVGLELKREFLEGEMREFSKVYLPAVAALGGMLVPALIYMLVNWSDTLQWRGWAIPVVTDIAFSLGVLSLFGRRVPLGLKLFLMTLAIFDDVGAIIIIAVVHSKAISLFALVSVALCLCVLFVMNKMRIQHLLGYLVVGFILWICVLSSGVHATIAGVLLSLMIPLRTSTKARYSPLKTLEGLLHPYVAYLIMPLFALANSGVAISGSFMDSLKSGVTLGIILGLFVGKQLGVFLFSVIIIKLKWAKLPDRTRWRELYGVSILCGIGFTMSLFLGTLAFHGGGETYLNDMRLGVLLGSLFSGLLGASLLAYFFRK